MKKRLLFMLTMMVLMFAVCFSASARDCAKDGHYYSIKEVVHPTCTTQGYDKKICETCGDFYKENLKDPLGHEWELVEYVKQSDGGYFKKQHCKRDNCDITAFETEKGTTAKIKYYLIEFYNGQAFDKQDKSVTVTSYGKVYEVPVDYVVLAEVPVENSSANTFTGTKCELLQRNYVKEGASITYTAKKPVRTMDMRYGAFRLIGWTEGKNYDTVSNYNNIAAGSIDNYRVTVKATKNATYYAAWEGVDISYESVVYNSDGKQLLYSQTVKHGGTIQYPYSYPIRESETSCDFEFAGWQIGTKNLAGEYNLYCPHDCRCSKCGTKGFAHLKDIPIFSNDGIKAYHKEIARKYTVEYTVPVINFVTVDGTEKAVYETKKVRYDSEYGADVEAEVMKELEKSFGEGSSYKLMYDIRYSAKINIEGRDPRTVSGVIKFDKDNLAYRNKTDESLAREAVEAELKKDKDFYGKNGGYTEFTFSRDYVYDYSDDTYLYFYKNAWETDKKMSVDINNFSVAKGSVDYNDPIYLKDENGNFFMKSDDKFLEITDIHAADDNGYFNKKVVTTLYPVNEKGENIVLPGGRQSTIIVYNGGIQQIDANGNRRDFSEDEAADFHIIALKPSYNRRVIDYKVTFKANIPVNDDYYATRIVIQVTNEYGQLIAAGVTENFECTLLLPKAEMYNVTAASSDGKYYAETGYPWVLFKPMIEGERALELDLSIDKDYSEEYQSSCRCICHNPVLKGVWVRVLNILYRLFNVKYVCCSDMYIALNGLLAYTK